MRGKMNPQKQGFDTCPRCGLRGSLQTKMVLNHQKRPYYYPYFEHYAERNGKTTKISWCYIGKKRMNAIPNPDVEDDEGNKNSEEG